MITDVLEQVTELRKFVTRLLPGDEPTVWLTVEEFAVLQEIEEKLQDCESQLLVHVASTKETEDEPGDL